MSDGQNQEIGSLKTGLDALRDAFEDFRDETRQWHRGLDTKLFGADGTEGVLGRQSRRIRRLELWQAGLLGGGTVIGWLLKAWVG